MARAIGTGYTFYVLGILEAALFLGMLPGAFAQEGPQSPTQDPSGVRPPGNPQPSPTPRPGKRSRARGAKKKRAQPCRPPKSAAWDPADQHSEEFAEQWERTTGGMDQNLEGRDPALQSGLRKLGNELAESSQGGEKGLTPDGARSIVEFLNCQQGGVSAEMQDLLKHLARDGATLRPDTMLRVKDTARQAKGGGLELGVDTEMEEWLLDPRTDPEAEPQTPEVN